MDKLTIKKINKMADGAGIKYLYLFGSQARGKATPRSDFDFAVKFDSKIKNTFKAKLKLMVELTSILKTEFIDVVDLDQANPILAFNIIKDGRVIFSIDEPARVMDRVRVMSVYYDRQYYYDRHFNIAINQMARGN